MSLTLCTDLSPARWIAASALPWQRLVTLGPAGFEAYARLRFIPDPEFRGQRESDVQVADGPSDVDRLRSLFTVLAAHTETPGECYFCLWDGYGELAGGGDGRSGAGPTSLSTPTTPAAPAPGAQPGADPSPTPSPAVDAPKVVVPNRSYYLFSGPLAEAGDWGTASPWPHADMPPPAFAWPADHAWCVTSDVDPHWAGIGAASSVIAELLDDRALDVVPADPTRPQPAYH